MRTPSPLYRFLNCIIFLPFIVGAQQYAPEVYAPASRFEVQPPPPVRVTDAIADFKTDSANLSTWQTDTEAKAGVYIQMLWTAQTAPTADDTVQNYLDIAPSDTLISARQIFDGAKIATDLPYRLSMDVYAAPCGDGYTISAEMIDGKTLWRRVANYGCERFREMDWTAIQLTGVITP